MQGLCCIKEKNSRQGGTGRGNAATGKADFVCRKRRENMGQVKGRIHSVETFGLVDGPGVR